jgi:putative transposase
LSYRQVEELMQERGVAVDHATSNRWVVKYTPQLEEPFHGRKRPVWVSWRMDETYIEVKGRWCYLYRAVDATDQTIDFLLTEHQEERAATHFLIKAIRRHGMQEKVTLIAVRPMPRLSGGTITSMALRSLSGRSNLAA